MLGLFIICFRIWTLCQNHFHLFPQLFIHILLCHSCSFFFGTSLYVSLIFVCSLNVRFSCPVLPGAWWHTVTHALCVSLLSGTTTMLLILHPAYSFRQLCVCTCVVLWLWGCGITQLRVIIWWLTRAGKTSGLWSSGHAAHPQPANQHHVPEVSKVQRTYGRALWCTCTCRTHQNQVP